MIVDEYGGKDGGHGRATAKSKNPFWIAEVNLRLPETPAQPFASEKGCNVVSCPACLRTNMIARVKVWQFHQLPYPCLL